MNKKYQKILLSLVKQLINSNFQEDHIFPKRELEKKGFDTNLINNIGNIQPLGNFTNNSKNNMRFVDWLNNEERSWDYKNFHMIPDVSSYEIDNFKEFLEERKKIQKSNLMILQELVKILGSIYQN